MLEVRDARVLGLVGKDARLERVTGGFIFTEGPVWDRRISALLFSDITGDRIYRWTRRVGTAVFRAPSHKANGNTFDASGRLLTCEHATSRVTRTEAGERPEVLAAEFDGKALNSPNDIVVHSSGAIYFTDPDFGRTREDVGVIRPVLQPECYVFRLDPKTCRLTVAASGFELPNGLCFSPDERFLYINDSPRYHVRRFEVTDGSLSGGEVFAELDGSLGTGRPDGMKVDVEGNLFCTGAGGIHIYAPDATWLGWVPVPEKASNLAWGDDDGQTLYITAMTSVYRLRTLTRGRLLP